MPLITTRDLALWRMAITLTNNICVEWADIGRSLDEHPQVVSARLACADQVRELLPQSESYLVGGPRPDEPSDVDEISERDRWVWHRAVSAAARVCATLAMEYRAAQESRDGVDVSSSVAAACGTRIEGYLAIDWTMERELLALLGGDTPPGTGRFRRLARRMKQDRVTAQDVVHMLAAGVF